MTGRAARSPENPLTLRDIAAQAARVVELLTDDDLCGRLSRSARHTAETRFCSTLIIPQYERYYQEVCGR